MPGSSDSLQATEEVCTMLACQRTFCTSLTNTQIGNGT